MPLAQYQSVRVGDAVEVLYPPNGHTRLGMIKEVHCGVLTMLVAGGEGHSVISVTPDRLTYIGPSFWQIAMRE